MGVTSLDDTILRRLERLRTSLKKKNKLLRITNSLIMEKALDLFERGGCELA